MTPCGRLGAQRDELLVVDQDTRLLALTDLGDLRPRERSIEQQERRAELRRGNRGAYEARVIAAEDRDPVALADAELAQAASEGVRLLVERSSCTAGRSGSRIAEIA
jgi:hypothetical protein